MGRFILALIRGGEQGIRRKQLLTACPELPNEREWCRTQSGKPFIMCGPAFSISHSRDISAIIVAKSATSIGLDIEVERDLPTWQRLADRFFLDEEIAYCRYCGSAGFWEVWLKKEAMVKCIGGSIPRMIRTADAIHTRINGIKMFVEYTLLAIDSGEAVHIAIAGFHGATIPSIIPNFNNRSQESS